MPDLNKIVAERICLLRTERNWTQAEAARRLSDITQKTISRSYWCNWESGADGKSWQRPIKQEHILALAKLFGVTPNYMSGYSNEREAGETQYITANSPTVTGRRGSVAIDQASGNLSFLVSRLIERGLNPNQILLVRAADKSMQGLIDEGDEFLVDLEKTNVVDADIFAIIVNGRIWARHIRPELDGTFTVYPEDSENWPTQRLTREQLAELEIVGRIASIIRNR